MSKIRKPAVSGMFYPSGKQELQKMVKILLQKAYDLPNSNPKAIIVPHAGYIYSGAVAASAYKPLKKLKDKIKRVVLFGPSHHESFAGLALCDSQYFETPLGKIEVDQNMTNLIKELKQVNFLNEAHESEHSLEVHLPFLQEVFDDGFKLLPIVVGDATPEEVGQVIEKLWNLEDAIIVVSTDLSHYHDYLTALQLDLSTCFDVENLEISALDSAKMCGVVAVKGLLYIAEEKNLKVKLVDFCNSGDSQYKDYLSSLPSSSNSIIEKLQQQDFGTIEKYLNNSGNQGVVGYGSYYVGSEKDLGYILSVPQKLELLKIAYKVIEHGVKYGELINNINTLFHFDHKTKISTFVTLKIDGDLRGCIGNIEPQRGIVEDVVYNAFASAFHDPRFPALSEEELSKIDIDISVLSVPEKLDFIDEEDLLNKIRPGIDGLILFENGGYQGTFLPSVWEELHSAEEFLNHLKLKAGLHEDYWSDTIEIKRYTAEIITI